VIDAGGDESRTFAPGLQDSQFLFEQKNVFSGRIFALYPYQFILDSTVLVVKEGVYGDNYVIISIFEGVNVSSCASAPVLL
jgi:hypothetical protein